MKTAKKITPAIVLAVITLALGSSPDAQAQNVLLTPPPMVNNLRISESTQARLDQWAQIAVWTGVNHDNNKTAIVINNRTMDSVDRQTASQERVAMGNIWSQVQMNQDRYAAMVQMAQLAAEAQARAAAAYNNSCCNGQGNPGPTPSGYARRRPQ